MSLHQPVPVFFLTVAAHSVSNARHGRGRLLGFDLIIGVKVGKSSVRFKHPDHEILVDEGAKPRVQAILMPQLMASRIMRFVQAKLVPEGQLYSCNTFAYYVSGVQPTPAYSSHRRDVWLATDQVDSVWPMRFHSISRDEEMLHKFIGLSDQRALSIHGFKGEFGIAPVQDLVYAYGGNMIGALFEAPQTSDYPS